MKIYKNMLLAFGFLLSGSVFAMIEQSQMIQSKPPVQSEAPAQSFIDTIQNVEWMNRIDGVKKGFMKGFMMQMIQDSSAFKAGNKSKKNIANQVVQELLYQIDQATSNKTQGAKYVAENMGRALIVAWNGFAAIKEAENSVVLLDTLKGSVQRLCDSSMDDFSSDKKVIARAVFKALLRGLVSLPLIDTDNDLFDDNPLIPPNSSSIVLAVSNTFLPLLIDGGTKLGNDKFTLVTNKNARRFAGIVKAIGRIGVGSLLGQKYPK